ncbi:MAG: hypothetical protein H8E00_00510 [Deltaproteobacteria bacterium]|nr:hypothetical protein [Deltaproteobacteria bacterium]
MNATVYSQRVVITAINPYDPCRAGYGSSVGGVGSLISSSEIINIIAMSWHPYIVTIIWCSWIGTVKLAITKIISRMNVYPASSGIGDGNSKYDITGAVIRVSGGQVNAVVEIGPNGFRYRYVRSGGNNIWYEKGERKKAKGEKTKRPRISKAFHEGNLPCIHKKLWNHEVTFGSCPKSVKGKVRFFYVPFSSVC